MGTPLEVTIRLYGLTPGESEVELSVPETSELGRLIADAGPEEQALLFARLRRHLVAELTDAFTFLESPSEPVPGPPAPRPARLSVAVGAPPSPGGRGPARGAAD